ncbi:Gfo/Idh/MocA family protein [Halosimplex sp. J119]
MDETVTVGVVGLGTHGANHARLLREMGHEVFGVDADPTARTEFEERFDRPAYESPTDLFDRAVDAVVITTPNKFHEPSAVGALEAGLDVLLEKPLAHDLESAERIAATARKTGNTCMVGFHHRHRRVTQVARSYVESGYLGELTHIDARYVRRRGVPGRGTWYTSGEIAGGGALVDIGAHCLDMLLYLSGWPELESVSADVDSHFGHRDDYAYLEMWGEDDDAKMYDVEDTVTAFCEFANGLTASVEVAWAANDEASHAYRIKGREAGAKLDITNSLDAIEPVPEERNDLTLYEVRSGEHDHFVDSEVHVRPNDPYVAELETFVEAVVSGDRPAETNVHEAIDVQRVIHRIYATQES